MCIAVIGVAVAVAVVVGVAVGVAVVAVVVGVAVAVGVVVAVGVAVVAVVVAVAVAVAVVVVVGVVVGVAVGVAVVGVVVAVAVVIFSSEGVMEPGLWMVEVATGKIYVLRVEQVDEDIRFSECAWIATTGVRVSQLIEKGVAPETEIERYTPGGIPRGAVVIYHRWPWDMPVTQ
jgi:hypothetical protein